MPPLDLAVQASLLAVLLGLIVLFSLFEKAVRRVVVREVLGVRERVYIGFWNVWLVAVPVP
jgi:hypothetical protein